MFTLVKNVTTSSTDLLITTYRISMQVSQECLAKFTFPNILKTSSKPKPLFYLYSILICSHGSYIWDAFYGSFLEISCLHQVSRYKIWWTKMTFELQKQRSSFLPSLWKSSYSMHVKYYWILPRDNLFKVILMHCCTLRWPLTSIKDVKPLIMTQYKTPTY